MLLGPMRCSFASCSRLEVAPLHRIMSGCESRCKLLRVAKRHSTGASPVGTLRRYLWLPPFPYLDGECRLLTAALRGRIASPAQPQARRIDEAACSLASAAS